MSLEEFFKGIDINKELMLIDYQPCEYEEVKKYGQDMILSSDTHAGPI